MGSHHDSSGSLNENSDGTGGKGGQRSLGLPSTLVLFFSLSAPHSFGSAFHSLSVPSDESVKV